MTIGPLPYGAGFLVLTHRLFQGNAIWGEGNFVPASTRSDVSSHVLEVPLSYPLLFLTKVFRRAIFILVALLDRVC